MKLPNTPVRRTAAYLRVSSIRQAKEGDSLEAQKNLIASYLLHNYGFERGQIVFYEDAGKSAKDQNRPELQRLRKDIEAGLIGRVVVYKLDRITRSLTDFAELWTFFGRYGVQIISINERFDTSGPVGTAMLNIIMVFAQLERELIGERTRSVMLDRIQRGLCNGNIKWGYRHDPDQNGRLVPDPVWAPIVREHFFAACERLGSAGAVQRHLTEAGIVVPTRKSPDGKVRGGKPFTKQQVIGVLSNPVYVGTLKWGEAQKEDCHEPLVARKQFDRVQRILERNRNTCNHRDPQGSYPFLLKGILRCRYGHMMTSYFSTGRNGLHYYYVCTNRTHRGKGTCDAPYVPAEAIDQAVVQRLLDLAGNETDRDKIIRLAIGLADEDARRVEGEAEQVRRRLAEVQGEINNLVNAIKTLGSEGVASVKEGLQQSEAERGRLRQRLDQLAEQQKSLGQITGDTQRFLEAWHRVKDLFDLADPAGKREIVQHFIESLDWTPADPKNRTGTYLLTFFPEVVQERKDEDPPDEQDGDATVPAKLKPRPPKGSPGNTNAEPADSDPALTGVPLVRYNDEKARQVGLEPTRRRRKTRGLRPLQGAQRVALPAFRPIYKPSLTSGRPCPSRSGWPSLRW